MRIGIETNDRAIHDAIHSMQPFTITQQNFGTPETIQALAKINGHSRAQANFVDMFFLWNVESWMNKRKNELYFNGTYLEMYQKDLAFAAEWNNLKLDMQMSTICSLIPLVRLVAEFPRLIFFSDLRKLHGRVKQIREQLLRLNSSGQWKKDLDGFQDLADKFPVIEMISGFGVRKQSITIHPQMNLIMVSTHFHFASAL
jgi:hypothetical protein